MDYACCSNAAGIIHKCLIYSYLNVLLMAPQLANTQASCSKQAAQAKPKGLLRLLCAGDAENVNQPGFYVEPGFTLSPNKSYKTDV